MQEFEAIFDKAGTRIRRYHCPIGSEKIVIKFDQTNNFKINDTYFENPACNNFCHIAHSDLTGIIIRQNSECPLI